MVLKRVNFKAFTFHPLVILVSKGEGKFNASVCRGVNERRPLCATKRRLNGGAKVVL